MNARIKQLEKQAFVKGHWSDDGERFIQSHTDMTKFAELIIRECMEQLEKEKFEHFSINRVGREHYNYGLTAGATAIKQHFGVEE
jgi:nicotinamide riboside kinase